MGKKKQEKKQKIKFWFFNNKKGGRGIPIPLLQYFVILTKLENRGSYPFLSYFLFTTSPPHHLIQTIKYILMRKIRRFRDSGIKDIQTFRTVFYSCLLFLLFLRYKILN
jgi:hypothetical protein